MMGERDQKYKLKRKFCFTSRSTTDPGNEVDPERYELDLNPIRILQLGEYMNYREKNKQ